MTDLRSDTFTRPGPAMLDFMAAAEVGDDVFGEDPTVNRLESAVASMFKMEKALFCPSGTMTNQIGIKCHTRPGDEVICDRTSHIYMYEGGGIAVNSLCQPKLLDGNRGMITAEMVEEAINPDDVHKPRTRLVSVENTANRGGGSCYDIEELRAIGNVCRENGLAFHLDGARLWNAMIAKEHTPGMYGEIFDSISVCLSKGLGAPVGSLLIGKKEFIDQARRVRKVMGGGMRQAGYLAAAGLYALEHNYLRLQKDHQHAADIAAALLKKDFIGKMLPVETNIIIFEVYGAHTPVSFTEFMKEHGILCLPISKTQVRMVTHLDVTEDMVKELIHLIDIMN